MAKNFKEKNMEEKQNQAVQENGAEQNESGFKGMLKKISDMGQKTACGVQATWKNISEKAKNDHYAKRLKK